MLCFGELIVKMNESGVVNLGYDEGEVEVEE